MSLFPFLEVLARRLPRIALFLLFTHNINPHLRATLSASTMRLFSLYCAIFIILAGASLVPCTLLLITIIWQKKTCLRNNLDCQTLGLLFTMFIYSMSYVVLHITNYTSDTLTSLNCTFSAIMIILVVGIHMTIALDRYFILVATNATNRIKTIIRSFYFSALQLL